MVRLLKVSLSFRAVTAIIDWLFVCSQEHFNQLGDANPAHRAVSVVPVILTVHVVIRGGKSCKYLCPVF